MLPKPLYESLPYFCLAAGAINTAMPTDAFQAIGGFILYCTGAAVWIMRSRYRRVDPRPLQLSRTNIGYLFWGRGKLLPEPLYEALPFIYIIIGIILQGYFETEAAIYSGFAVFVLGLLLLTFRHLNRSDDKSHHTKHIDM